MTLFLCFLVAATIGWTQEFASAHQISPSWEFVDENVCLQISESSFTVRAQYQFRLSWDATEMVFRYPFPADTSLGDPELLEASISGPSGWEALAVFPGDDCWRWVATPAGEGLCAIRIAYRQSMSGSRARYVLRSTQEWGRPIDRAVIVVRVPRNRQCHIVPALPLARTEDAEQIFRGEFLDFFPKDDLLVDLSEGN